MGWLPVALAAAAAWVFSSADRSGWMWVSIAVAVGCFWSYGVMHNFATRHAKMRADNEGGPNDLTERDLDAVPNRIAAANMVFSLAAVASLIGAVVVFLS